MSMEEIGAAATEAARDRAADLDRTQPGWWREAAPEIMAGDGGSLYAVALQGSWGLEIARRKGIDRKLAELRTSGAVNARRGES